jgi:hypothetical protein
MGESQRVLVTLVGTPTLGFTSGENVAIPTRNNGVAHKPKRPILLGRFVAEPITITAESNGVSS